MESPSGNRTLLQAMIHAVTTKWVWVHPCIHTGRLRHRLVSTDGNKPLGDEDDHAAVHKRKKQLPDLSEKSRQSVRWDIL